MTAIWVGLIGLLVGTVELVARYRDDPWRALRTAPAALYVVINVLACVLVLYVLETVRPSWLFTANTEPDARQVLYLILTAGFGAVALFRSSLFKIRTTDGEIAVGPSIILDTLLVASDRAVDRIIAAPRGVAVAEVMAGVSFDRCKAALPAYCFALMQNVSSQEQKEFGDQVISLSNAPMDDHIRSLNLGLALMNLVGGRVLKSAVHDLGDLIKGDPPIEQREVAKVAELMKNVDFTKARLALPVYCFGLASNVGSEMQAGFLKQVQTLDQSQLPARVCSLTLGLGLSNLVGLGVLKLAVEQLDGDIKIEPRMPAASTLQTEPPFVGSAANAPDGVGRQ